MYRAIKQRPKVREGYLENLLKPGGVTQAEADRIEEERREHLEAELQAAKQEGRKLKADAMGGIWQGFIGGPYKRSYEVNTGLPVEQLKELLLSQTQMPAGFTPHPKIVRWLDNRREMAKGNKKLDWVRSTCIRQSLEIGNTHSYHRTRQRTWYLQPSACGSARLRNRQNAYSTPTYGS